jgi:hypothetical protein
MSLSPHGYYRREDGRSLNPPSARHVRSGLDLPSFGDGSDWIFTPRREDVCTPGFECTPPWQETHADVPIANLCRAVGGMPCTFDGTQVYCDCNAGPPMTWPAPPVEQPKSLFETLRSILRLKTATPLPRPKYPTIPEVPVPGVCEERWTIEEISCHQRIVSIVPCLLRNLERYYRCLVDGEWPPVPITTPN